MKAFCFCPNGNGMFPQTEKGKAEIKGHWERFSYVVPYCVFGKRVRQCGLKVKNKFIVFDIKKINNNSLKGLFLY